MAEQVGIAIDEIAADGSRELPVPSYELFNDTELLGRMALKRMLAAVSTRRYPASLEPVG